MKSLKYRDHLVHRVLRPIGLVLAVAWTPVSLAAMAVTATDAEEPRPEATEVIIAGGEVSLENGSDAAQLRQDFGLREGGSGGLERFLWIGSDAADWVVRIDARVVENPDDVRFDLLMEKPEEALFHVHFRHWTSYDSGVGPWYPAGNLQFVLTPKELEKELSRLEIRYERNLTDVLRMELCYSLFDRDGAALSSRLGDDFQYRIGGHPSRGIVPALLQTDERVQTLDARFVWQEWVNLSGLRLHAQRRESSTVHTVERGVVDRMAQRWSRQSESSADDLFAMSAFTRREWGDTMVGSVGFGFTRLDGTVSGHRIFGSTPEAAFDPDFAALQFEDRGFLDLENSRQLRQWIFNFNLVANPTETIRWMAGTRLEKLNTRVFGSYLDTYSTVDWDAVAFQREQADMLSGAEKSVLDLSGFVEVRYSGFSKWLLFTRIEATREEGDLDEEWTREEVFPDDREPISLLDRATEFDRKAIFWEAGAHFYPWRKLHLSIKGYLKEKENDYSLAGVELPIADYTAYPGHIIQQRVTIEDVNARVMWRVHPSLKLLSRVDYQESRTENTDRRLTALDSAERRRVVYNQSLTWAPARRLFLSAQYTRVDDLTESLAADLEGVFAGIVSNLPNDYWQMNASAYVVLTKRFDLQLQYQYLEMDNFIDSSPQTIAYGSSLTLETASAGIILHLGEGIRTHLEYRYFERFEPSANNLTDYTAHLLSGTVQVIF
jgi:hypothetical protein